MKQNKKYIIITGQIASGKSTISSIVEKTFPEFLILDADNMVNELYKRGAKLYDVIVKEFGKSVLNEKGNISKAKLREVVFFNEKNRKKLNSLTHGVILENMVNIAKKSDSKVIFMQIPILNEVIGKLKKLIKIDEVWNIVADEEIRFKRLLTRKGITEEIAKKIIKTQSEFKNDNYDVIDIENNKEIIDIEKIFPEIIENSCINKIVKSMNINFNSSNETEQNIKYEEVLEVKEDLKVEENIEEKDFVDLIFENKLEEKNENSSLNEENIESLSYFNLGDTTKIDVIEEKSSEYENFDDSFFKEYDEQRKNIENKEFVNFVDENLENEVEKNLDEESKLKKTKKTKKKKSIKKKILFIFISLLVVLNALFFGSIAYGGKNYSLNYLEEINKYSSEYGVDPKIVLAIMRVESNFDANAQSKANAKGLMQILPDTAKHIANLLKVDINKVDLNDPDTNIQFGTYYIKYLMQNFKNLDTVYAAYNGGIGNVNTWLKDEKYSNDGITLYNIPSSETKHYVYKVNKAIDAYEILYGKEFPTKKEKGFNKFFQNTKNVIKYIFSSF